MRPTQKQRVLAALHRGRRINRLLAWSDLGILELPARVHELRQDGHRIRRVTKAVTNRYGETFRIAEYFMNPEDIE